MGWFSDKINQVQSAISDAGNFVNEHVIQPVVAAAEETIIHPVQETAQVAVDFINDRVITPVVEAVDTSVQAVSDTVDQIAGTIDTTIAAVSDVAGSIVEAASNFVDGTASAFEESPVDGIIHLMPAYHIWKAVDPDNVSETPFQDLVDEIGGSGPIQALTGAFDWLKVNWGLVLALVAGGVAVVFLLKGKMIRRLVNGAMQSA